MAEPPGGVEPRRENKTNATGGELPAGQSGCADQCALADVVRLGEHLQSIPDEDAVFPPQRRDVSNRCERYEVEHPPDEVLVLTEGAGKCKRELECNADRGEILIGIAAAAPLRIEYRQTVREGSARKVV